MKTDVAREHSRALPAGDMSLRGIDGEPMSSEFSAVQNSLAELEGIECIVVTSGVSVNTRSIRELIPRAKLVKDGWTVFTT
jgi:hypothetical protein